MRADLRRIRGEKKKNRDAREGKQGDGVGKRCVGEEKRGTRRGNTAGLWDKPKERRYDRSEPATIGRSFLLNIIWVIFSLFIYRAGKTKRKGRMGKERGQTEGKAPPALFGEARNPTGNPSGWSRDGFGMESPIRTGAFPTPNCLPAHSMRTGLKSGVKNEVNFVGR